MCWRRVKCILSARGQLKGGLTCCHLVKCVLRAWGQFLRGLEVLALGEICFEGMAAVAKGVSGVCAG